MAEVRPYSSNRTVLLLIAGIPLMVILISTWLWYYVVHGDLNLVAIMGTSNNGALLRPPRKLSGVELSQPGGAQFLLGERGSRWTLLIPGGPVCDSVCEKTLYITRQIHTALGADFNRVRRVYVSEAAPAEVGLELHREGRPAPANFAALLAAEHTGLAAVTIATADFRVLLPEYRRDSSTWYLVDPAGWIMMSYNREVDYKGVLSDLEFLLKNSSG